MSAQHGLFLLYTKKPCCVGPGLPARRPEPARSRRDGSSAPANTPRVCPCPGQDAVRRHARRRRAPRPGAAPGTGRRRLQLARAARDSCPPRFIESPCGRFGAASRDHDDPSQPCACAPGVAVGAAIDVGSGRAEGRRRRVELLEHREHALPQYDRLQRARLRHGRRCGSRSTMSRISSSWRRLAAVLEGPDVVRFVDWFTRLYPNRVLACFLDCLSPRAWYQADCGHGGAPPCSLAVLLTDDRVGFLGTAMMKRIAEAEQAVAGMGL